MKVPDDIRDAAERVIKAIDAVTEAAKPASEKIKIADEVLRTRPIERFEVEYEFGRIVINPGGLGFYRLGDNQYSTPPRPLANTEPAIRILAAAHLVDFLDQYARHIQSPLAEDDQ